MKSHKIVEVGILDYSIFQYRLELYVHALRRYQFAASFLNKEDHALDICCGSGYGTNVLRQSCEKALGVDRNEAMLAFSQTKYPDCDFYRADINQFHIGLAWDILTMYECLEHLAKEDGLALIAKAAKGCRRMLFLSSPCDSKRDINQWHLSEWTDKELEAELRKYFHTVVILGQSWSSGVISFPYDERRSFTVAIGVK